MKDLIGNSLNDKQPEKGDRVLFCTKYGEYKIGICLKNHDVKYRILDLAFVLEGTFQEVYDGSCIKYWWLLP